jgi:hypothetical protein
MPDGSDPGRVERYTDRQVERVRQTVHEPNRSDILQIICKGKRGNISSPKPNQRMKPSWSKATVRNNTRNLRILAGQLQGLEDPETVTEAVASLVSDSTSWVVRYPNARLQAERAGASGLDPGGGSHREDGREATPTGVFRPLIRSVVPIYRHIRRPVRRNPELIDNRPYHAHRSVGEDETRPPVERESRRVA